MVSKLPASQPLIADLVITNGKVVTVDKKFTIAQAVAVKNSRIIAVGTNDDIQAFVGQGTQVLDIQGKTMLPGINEAHIHAALFGGARPPLVIDVGYPTVTSIGDIVKKVDKKVRDAQPGEWIQGVGWDAGYLDECLEDPTRRLTRWDLDPVSPENPVSLSDMSSHMIWVNSKALELAGITADTPSPAGGEIIREPSSGEPTGVLQELPALELVMRLIPPWDKNQKRQAILTAMKELNSLGITSITEAGLGPGGGSFQGGLFGSECISIYNDLYNEGKLTLRVNILLLFGEYGKVILKDLQQSLSFLGIHTGFGNEWLRIAGVKIFADGVPPARTAWMYEEYPDSNGVKGRLVIPGKTDEERHLELIHMMAHAHKLGFQMGIHSCGDRAIDAVVDGLIKAMKEEPDKDLRHYIIHGDFATKECARRMGQWNIGVNAQPAIKYVASDLMDIIMSEERSARHFPCRLFLDSKIPMAFGSDAPVVYPNWKQGIEAAVLRESKGTTGKVSGPEQRITREEAIRAYTMGGAYQDHMEHTKGSIEVGKLADFCILGEDILAIESHTIKDIPTVMTIIGGKIVFDASNN